MVERSRRHCVTCGPGLYQPEYSIRRRFFSNLTMTRLLRARICFCVEEELRGSRTISSNVFLTSTDLHTENRDGNRARLKGFTVARWRKRQKVSAGEQREREEDGMMMKRENGAYLIMKIRQKDRKEHERKD